MAAAHEIAKEYPPLNTEGKMTFEEYKAAYAESIKDPAKFWAKEARERLDWFQPFVNTLSGDFEAGDVAWFTGGKLNVCYNAVDRHVNAGKGNDVAIVWEGTSALFTFVVPLSSVENTCRRDAAARPLQHATAVESSLPCLLPTLLSESVYVVSSQIAIPNLFLFQFSNQATNPPTSRG